MGVFDQLAGIKGLGFLNNISFSGIFSGIGNLIVILLAFGIVAVIVGLIYYRLQEKAEFNIKGHFFEEVNGNWIPLNDLKFKELTVPNTNVRVFYNKEKDLYMPRGTRLMGHNSYWYGITNNREIINFSLKNLNKQLAEMNLAFDHTDMRYSHLNLAEIIKRNYKDKSVKWWKEYKDLISTIIFIFVMSLAFFFLIGRIGTLIDKIGPMLERIDLLLDKANSILESTKAIKSGSGIINQ